MATKAATKFTEFDPADYLTDRETILHFLRAAFEDGDLSHIKAALDAVARSKGMSSVAKETGITREALYKALRPDAQPRFDTVNRVCAALGVKLAAQAVHT